MQLIIAEKPTLARLIVNSMKNDRLEKKDGYFEGQKYLVSYGFGHLFSEYDIEDYIGEEGRKWSVDILPFCPPNRKFLFKLIGKRGKDGKYVPDPGIKHQFHVIKTLIARNDVTEIVHAGDADREGEILLRLIIRNANPSHKIIKRLWVQEQTENEIWKGMNSLRPDSEFDNLANEGFARSYTDWLDGINLTRYFSIKAGAPIGHPFRIGRVICAMVKEIYDRDLAIQNFVPVPFYAVVSEAETNGEKITLKCKDTFPIDKLNDAENKCVLLNSSPAIVTDIRKETKTVRPGKLYSLTSLQNSLLKKFGMPLTKSEKVIQSVYEKGYITYPRTNTEYLGESEKDKAKQLIDIFKKQGFNLEFKDTKAIFDSSKVESHSALVPTYKIPTGLDEDEQKVYDTVKNRFLAVFCAEKCLVDRTIMEISCADEKFVLNGDVLTQKGFIVYDPAKISETTLPKLQKGSRVNVNFEPKKGETTPPKHYTATTFNTFLLSPFHQKKKGEDDTELYEEIMKGVEIGTVASRTDIIAKIVANKYINESKGTYTIAPAGIYLIESMQKLGISMDKFTTVRMSVMLKEIYNGTKTIDDAITVCMTNLHNIMDNNDITIPSCVEAGIVATTDKYGREVVGKCPVCGGNVFESKNAFICENNRKDTDDCFFYLYKQDKYFAKVYEHEITKSAAARILKNGKYTDKKKTVMLTVDRDAKRVKWSSASHGSSTGRKTDTSKFDPRGANFSWNDFYNKLNKN